jgi:hypothetical protein
MAADIPHAGRPAAAHSDTWIFLDTDDDRVDVEIEPARGGHCKLRLRSQLPLDAPSLLGNFVVSVYVFGSPARLERLLTEALEGVRVAAAKQPAAEGR